MGNQGSLFDTDTDYDQYGGTPPHVKRSDTSRAAAESVAFDAKHLRAVVFNHILGSGAVGLTCDQVEEIMDGRHQTISARIRELRNEGRIVDSTRRRPTRSGRQAIVYLATCNATPEIINAEPTPRKQKPWQKVTLGEVAAAFAGDGLEINRLTNGQGFAIIEGQTRSAQYSTFQGVIAKLAQLTLERTVP
jgi:hypothetical protein